MARAWVKRWTTSGKDHRRNDLRILRIHPRTQSSAIEWRLPPSKSHLIRALALFAQTTQSITLHNVASSGDDVRAMRNCLTQLGVHFDDYDGDGNHLSQTNPMELGPHPESQKWVLHGVGVTGFRRPAAVLNAANSGTALRILAGLVARMDGPVMLDGDQSLRRRDSEPLWGSLRQAGVDVSMGQGSERLPVILSGPWKPEHLGSGISLDISQSSQHLSSWMLASSCLPVKVKLNLEGKAVSSRHSKLTSDMIETTGGSVVFDEDACFLEPWNPVCQESYTVPGDASMASFAVLAAFCFSSEINLQGWPGKEDAIGHEILHESSIDFGIMWESDVLRVAGTKEPVHLDVTDSNDILPPMSALLALGGGGTITGAAHAAHKESNRLVRTVELLSHFGLKATLLPDGIQVEGGQVPKRPIEPVPTFEDHRLFMTAVLLACKTGGEVLGQTLHHVADEAFLQRLLDAGVNIQAVQIPSLKD